MNSEFIQNVAHEIIMMMIFNISTSYFSQKFHFTILRII